MENKKRFKHFVELAIPIIIGIVLGVVLLALLVYTGHIKKNTKTSTNVSTATSTLTPEETNKQIILNAIVTNPEFPPHLTNEEITLLLACQSFVKEHEKDFGSDCSLVPVDDNYSLRLDFDTRQLYVRDKQGMERRLLGLYTTIDHNPRDIFYQYRNVRSNRNCTFTFSANNHYIREYHLGEEIACYSVPEEILQKNKKPELLYSLKDSKQIIITDTTYENAPLFLVTDEESICLSNNFSKLPIRVWEFGSRIFYIESDLSLYMYDINTRERTHLAGNVFDFPRGNDEYDNDDDDWKYFRSVDGTFHINLSIDENGETILKDEDWKPTDSIISKSRIYK